MENFKFISIAFSLLYWLGTIRILVNLKGDSLWMYFPVMNIFLLGKRVGLGFLFWLFAVISVLGPAFLLGNGNPRLATGIMILMYSVFTLLFWLRVAAFSEKPSYLAYLQLVPLINIWALWEMGSTRSHSQPRGIVLQNDYEKQLVQWMAESIEKGVSRLQIEEQLKEHNLQKEVFLELYKKAVAQEREKSGGNILS